MDAVKRDDMYEAIKFDPRKADLVMLLEFCARISRRYTMEGNYTVGTFVLDNPASQGGVGNLLLSEDHWLILYRGKLVDIVDEATLNRVYCLFPPQAEPTSSIIMAIKNECLRLAKDAKKIGEDIAKAREKEDPEPATSGKEAWTPKVGDRVRLVPEKVEGIVEGIDEDGSVVFRDMEKDEPWCVSRKCLSRLKLID